MSNLSCRIASPHEIDSAKVSLPVWYNPVWMQSIADLYGILPQILICSKDQRDIAYLPYYTKKLLTLKKAYNPVLVYYCPLIFIYEARKNLNRDLLFEYEIIKEMGGYLNKNYRRINLNLSPDIYDSRGFKDAGLTTKPLYTFTLDLKEDTLFFPDEMKKLRRAQKQDFSFDTVFELNGFLELLYSMYDRKTHTFPITRNDLKNLLLKLHEAEIIDQYNIRDGNGIVSSQIVLKEVGRKVYCWLAATEAAALNKGASILMYWQLFQHLKTDYQNCDLCGANSSGPARLKAALGAELKLFFQVSK
ncbi:MAG: hypothetical protein FJ041_01985 [Candidatus Cloacimonetes bacterium]|nr:hypothetical protein [Candidatus Cloacimonadota bacterium]